MKEPLHWPPGAPVLFAVGHTLFPGANDAKTYDIRSAYWEQARAHDGHDPVRGAARVAAGGPVGGGGWRR